MDKVIRDGKVAVLYSNGYGAGWYTCEYNEGLLFDPFIVNEVEEKKEGWSKRVRDYCVETYGRNGYYDCFDLEIKWVPLGVDFHVHEYDGLEDIRLKDEIGWIRVSDKKEEPPKEYIQLCEAKEIVKIMEENEYVSVEIKFGKQTGIGRCLDIVNNNVSYSITDASHW